MKTKQNLRPIFWGGAAALLLAGLGLLVLLFIPGWRGTEPASASRPDYWPTQGWLTSTPEEQGLDSAKLAEGLRQIQQNKIPIHSLLLVRNGRVVLDATFYPYDSQSPHSVASVTKSLTTLLIGIAIDQRKLGLDDKLVSFFPDYPIANLDARKKAVSIRDLASMSAGFDCTGLSAELTVQSMEASPNWVQFGLDLPMAYQPSTHWEYCGVNMHLLSAILQKATGMTALEFARQNLFKPLGIQDASWPSDPQGINLGAGNTRLKPADMAKIGFLFLHGGLWEDKQIVSRSWVEDSVKKHYSVPNGDDYGYGWWSSADENGKAFFAQGNGGQRIVVAPDKNLVVVTTGGGFTFDDIVPYILAAFLDPKNPLPANPAGVAELEQVLRLLPQQPASQPVPVLPDVAAAISGKTIRLGENPFEIASLRLDFDDTPAAGFQVTFSDGTQSPLATVGLDGVYRLTPGMNLDRAFHRFVDFQNLSVGLRGHWVDAQTFLLDYDTIVDYYYYQLQMHFEADEVTIEATEGGGGNTATFSGRLQRP